MQDMTNDGTPEGEIEFLWKHAPDGGPCFTTSCPALYRGHGGWFVQHIQVTDPAVRAQLEAVAAANGTSLGPGEEFGWVPDIVISRVRDL